MGPKKDAPSKKTEQKKATKIVDDKTFGLKNKNKSKVVQTFVKSVTNQVQNQGKGTMEKVMADEIEKKKQQKIEEEKKALLCSIFKSVETVKGMQKEDDGESSTKICPYFKQGLCNKGKKCKFSHELPKETKKIDIYTDQRNQYGEEKEELDPEKLKELIKSKEGQYKKQSATELVCKYFLTALEKETYGWKWMCPNGLDCHYRHCLPPGYVLKKDVKKEDEEQKLRIEDVIDEQRENFVRASGTLVTLERFLEWKKKRAEKKLADEEKRKEDLQKKSKGGKRMVGLTGRALFVFDPSLFQDDADAADEQTMQNREEVEQADDDDEEERKASEQRLLLLSQQNNKVEEQEEDEEEEEQKVEEVEQPAKEETKPQEPPKNDKKYIEVDESEMFG